MNRFMVAALIAVMLWGCGKSPIQVWDQTHIGYNGVVGAAMTYAEQPGTDPDAARLIADIVKRTAEVVERASVVADLPQTEDTVRYLDWAKVVIDEALKQLQAFLIAGAEQPGPEAAMATCCPGGLV